MQSAVSVHGTDTHRGTGNNTHDAHLCSAEQAGMLQGQLHSRHPQWMYPLCLYTQPPDSTGRLYPLSGYCMSTLFIQSHAQYIINVLNVPRPSATLPTLLAWCTGWRLDRKIVKTCCAEAANKKHEQARVVNRTCMHNYSPGSDQMKDVYSCCSICTMHQGAPVHSMCRQLNFGI